MLSGICERYNRFLWWLSISAGAGAGLVAAYAVALMWLFGAPLPVAEITHAAEPYNQTDLLILFPHRLPHAVAGAIIGHLAMASLIMSLLALSFMSMYLAAAPRKADISIDFGADRAIPVVEWAGISLLLTCNLFIFLFANRLALSFAPVWPIAISLTAGVFVVGCTLLLRCRASVYALRAKARLPVTAPAGSPRLSKAMSWIVFFGAIASLLCVGGAVVKLFGTTPDWVRDLQVVNTMRSGAWAKLALGFQVTIHGREATFARDQWLVAPLLIFGGAAFATLALSGEILQLIVPSQSICSNCRYRRILRTFGFRNGHCATCGLVSPSLGIAVARLFIAGIVAGNVVVLFQRRFYWNPGTKHLIWWPIMYAEVFISLLLLMNWRSGRR